jgi:hypothetical protein
MECETGQMPDVGRGSTCPWTAERGEMPVVGRATVCDLCELSGQPFHRSIWPFVQPAKGRGVPRGWRMHAGGIEEVATVEPPGNIVCAGRMVRGRNGIHLCSTSTQLVA